MNRHPILKFFKRLKLKENIKKRKIGISEMNTRQLDYSKISMTKKMINFSFRSLHVHFLGQDYNKITKDAMFWSIKLKILIFF
jgi:hypothetical protein